MRDPEVGEQRPPRGRVDQDIVRLHVAMHHAARMRVVQRLADIAQHPAGGVRVERAARRDTPRQRFPRHVRHREEHEPVHLAHGEDRHDVGMRQLRHGPRLAQEPVAIRAVTGQIRV